MFDVWTETDRQTATLKCEISTVWEMKPRTTPQTWNPASSVMMMMMIFSLLMIP